MEPVREFPGVVDLCVGGTHNYRALLATLTKESDSTLAQMFTGQVPIYKDKDGRFFIEGDGHTFQAILEYLKYDTMPDTWDEVTMPTAGGGLFGGGLFGGDFGGGLFGGGGTFRGKYNKRDILLIHRNATMFGLKRLAEHLEQHSHVVVHNKLQEYRQSKRGYDNCLAKVLAAIPPEDLLMKDYVTVRIRQDFQDVEEKCCEHTCRQPQYQSFGFPYVYGVIDADVKVAFEVDSPLLATLCYDLLQRGFTVHGRETHCDFVCVKNRNSGGLVFRGQGYCCRRKLYLLNFTLHGNRRHVNQPNGFNFGTAPVKQQQSLFGQQKAVQNPFGSAPQQGSAFGSAPQQGSVAFGSAQGSSFGFGSAQQANNTGMFGSGQQQTNNNAGGGLFGSSSKPAPSHTFGSSPTFQNTLQQPSQAFSGFGASTSPPSGGGLFGSLCLADTPPPEDEISCTSTDSTQGFSFGGAQVAGSTSGQTQSAFGSSSPFGQVNTTKGSGNKNTTVFGGGFSFGASTTPQQQRQQQTSVFSGFGAAKNTTPKKTEPFSFRQTACTAQQPAPVSQQGNVFSIGSNNNSNSKNNQQQNTVAPAKGGFSFGPVRKALPKDDSESD